jgi:hypothetical protein
LDNRWAEPVLNFLKKLIYLWLIAYLAFFVTSILFGGGIVRGIGEKLGLHYFEKLAEEGDAIKRKADSLLGRADATKAKEEGKEKLPQ